MALSVKHLRNCALVGLPLFGIFVTYCCSNLLTGVETRSTNEDQHNNNADNCTCVSSAGVPHDFCFANRDALEVGRAFNCSWMSFLERFDLLIDDNESQKHSGLWANFMGRFIFRAKTLAIEEKKVAFVTAVSSNHFNEVKALVKRFRELFGEPKNQSLFIYDLGLNKSEAEELRQACNVIYRQFNFSAFPSYVQNVYEYRWKPLIQAVRKLHL